MSVKRYMVHGKRRSLAVGGGGGRNIPFNRDERQKEEEVTLKMMQERGDQVYIYTCGQARIPGGGIPPP